MHLFEKRMTSYPGIILSIAVVEPQGKATFCICLAQEMMICYASETAGELVKLNIMSQMKHLSAYGMYGDPQILVDLMLLDASKLSGV